MDQNDPAPSHVQLGRRLAEEDPQAHQNVVQAMSSFFENRQAVHARQHDIENNNIVGNGSRHP